MRCGTWEKKDRRLLGFWFGPVDKWMMIPFTEEKTSLGKDVIIRDRADQSKVTLLSLNVMCFYLSCVCAKLLQLCPTLCHPMDYSPAGSSVYGILQARILEWIAMPSCRGASQLLSLTSLLHWHVDSLSLAPPGKLSGEENNNSCMFFLPQCNRVSSPPQPPLLETSSLRLPDARATVFSAVECYLVPPNSGPACLHPRVQPPLG